MFTKQNIKIIAMLSTITIIIFYLTLDVRNKTQELQVVKASLIEAQKPSKIEELKTALQKNDKNIIGAKETLEKAKKLYEENVWLWRCIEVNIEKELKNEKLDPCDNLEQFAEYNIVK